MSCRYESWFLGRIFNSLEFILLHQYESTHNLHIDPTTRGDWNSLRSVGKLTMSQSMSHIFLYNLYNKWYWLGTSIVKLVLELGLGFCNGKVLGCYMLLMQNLRTLFKCFLGLWQPIDHKGITLIGPKSIPETTRICKFLRMNPPGLFWSKMGEDPKDFLDEVYSFFVWCIWMMLNALILLLTNLRMFLRFGSMNERKIGVQVLLFLSGLYLRKLSWVIIFLESWKRQRINSSLI